MALGAVLKQAIFMIPTHKAPRLCEPSSWSLEFNDFLSKCLVKDSEKRASAKELLEVKAPHASLMSFLSLPSLFLSVCLPLICLSSFSCFAPAF